MSDRCDLDSNFVASILHEQLSIGSCEVYEVALCIIAVAAAAISFGASRLAIFVWMRWTRGEPRSASPAALAVMLATPIFSIVLAGSLFSLLLLNANARSTSQPSPAIIKLFLLYVLGVFDSGLIFIWPFYLLCIVYSILYFKAWKDNLRILSVRIYLLLGVATAAQWLWLYLLSTMGS